MGIKCRSSGRATSASNHWVISPAPLLDTYLIKKVTKSYRDYIINIHSHSSLAFTYQHANLFYGRFLNERNKTLQGKWIIFLIELFSPTPQRQPPPWILWVGCYFKYCFHQLFYRQLHLSSFLIYYCKWSQRSPNPLKILCCFIICNDLFPPPFSASGGDYYCGFSGRYTSGRRHPRILPHWNRNYTCPFLYCLGLSSQMLSPVVLYWTLLRPPHECPLNSRTEAAALCQSNTNALPCPKLQCECHLLPQMPMADTQLSTWRDSQLLSDSMPCFLSLIMLYILKHWNQKVTVLLIFT